jgi:hypothetical protein
VAPSPPRDFGRWHLRVEDGEGRVNLYVDDAELGRVLVGSLFLKAADVTELREIFARGCGG